MARTQRGKERCIAPDDPRQRPSRASARSDGAVGLYQHASLTLRARAPVAKEDSAGAAHSAAQVHERSSAPAAGSATRPAVRSIMSQPSRRPHCARHQEQTQVAAGRAPRLDPSLEARRRRRDRQPAPATSRLVQAARWPAAGGWTAASRCQSPTGRAFPTLRARGNPRARDSGTQRTQRDRRRPPTSRLAFRPEVSVSQLR